MTEKSIKHNSKQDTIRVLPVFRGYTVDARVGEFRKVNPDTSMEWLDFRSSKGDKLLEEYIETLDVDSDEYRAIAAYFLRRSFS